MDQQSWITQRAKYEYGLLKQECETLHYSQPQAYEACLEKAKSTRENLLTQAQGSQQAGQGSQGSASNQSGQSGQKQGPIDKVTSVVKEKLVDWGLASPDQGQSSAGQQGQGSQQGSSQARNPLQASFSAGQGTQGQAGQQSFGGGTGQGGQNADSKGFRTGSNSRVSQSNLARDLTRGVITANSHEAARRKKLISKCQTGRRRPGYHRALPANNAGTTSRSAGEEEEHMDSVAYYQELARRQYATLKQECDALKKDPSVYEQCQTYTKSVRDRIEGWRSRKVQMRRGSNQRGG